MIRKNLKIISFIVFIFFQTVINAVSIETKIILKLNNEIITNLDIETEYRYLLILNQKLRDVDDKTMFKVAKQSLIKEVIKKNELNKYLNLKKEKNDLVDQTIEGLYLKLGLKSKNDFKIFLKKAKLNFDDIYEKFKIEVFWNQLIYTKFSNQVNINKELIKKNILNNSEQQDVFNLSEIVYEIKTKDEINKKYLEIIKNIEDIGFEKTVLLSSISPSKNNSGSIGWIRKNSLSQKIIAKIKNLKINQISEPIIVPSGILILRLNEKKQIKEKLDLKKELDKEINRKLNDQLNNYSTIYFNKIKKNYIINEY